MITFLNPSETRSAEVRSWPKAPPPSVNAEGSLLQGDRNGERGAALSLKFAQPAAHAIRHGQRSEIPLMRDAEGMPTLNALKRFDASGSGWDRAENPPSRGERKA